jgi:hypothetical protein
MNTMVMKVRVSPLQGSKDLIDCYQGRRAAFHFALRPLAFESRPVGALLSGPNLIDSRCKFAGLVQGTLIRQKPSPG